MVSQKKAWLILAIIVAVSLGMRLVRPGLLPLNWDEVSHGYNAYSLLLTGADQWGAAFPVFNFRAYGDYPATLNLYMTVLPVWLFGPTDLALRLPHILIGVLTVILAYITGVYWQKSRLTGLILAMLVAFEPWTFFPSRAVFQSNWAVLLLFAGLAFYFSGKRLPAVLVWGGSLFAYHNTRIFIPLLMLFLLTKPKIRTNHRQMAAIISVLVLALGILWFSQARARGNWVGILDSGAVAYIEQQRNISPLPAPLARLFYNRPVFMVTNVIKNYLGYFSVRFLFLQGGTQYQFSQPGFGLINPLFLPFFYWGIYQMYRRRMRLELFWLLLSPLPAAITRDQFAVIRATTMIPAVYMAAGLGLVSIIRKSGISASRPVIALFLGIYGFFAWTYYAAYFTRYPVRYAAAWQYGNRQMVGLVKKYFYDFDRIFITKRYGEPHEYLLWYWPWDPALYRTDPGLSWDFHDNWYWVNAFSRFVFVNDWEMKDIAGNLPAGGRYLFVSAPDSRPAGAQVDQIDYPDGSPAYLLTAI